MPEFVSKVATPVSIGFMSAADKAKLDSLTPGSGTTDIFFWGNDNIGAAADTRYLDPGRGGVASTSASTRQVPVPRGGTVRNLVVRHNTAGGNGNNVVYTVAKNGVATGLTVTVPTGAVVQVTDLVNTFTVVLGDRISLAAVKAAGIGGGGVDMQATVEIG